MKKTYQPKSKDVVRKWHLIDAKDVVLGRLATRVANLLMGKHKRVYANHIDMGDWVVVINSKDIKVTGRKESQKIYYKHSGYPGGFKEVSYAKLKKERPERIIELAVTRMLPKNRLQSVRMGRLKVFAGSEHVYKEKFGKGEKNNAS